MSTILHNIGLLVTNAEEGEVPDAWLVYEGQTVTEIGTGKPPAADAAIDADAKCVIPGFVDSHTHLIFAGDRSQEFAARMAGQPYEPGGILKTVEATRSASDDELLSLGRGRLREAHRGGTTTLEIKSGYGLTVEDEARMVEVAKRLSAETTLLGAHMVPPEYADRPNDYVELVCDEMVPSTSAKWIDVFCEEGAFDPDQSKAILTAGRSAGLGLRIHANQLGLGRGVELAVELDCASADHCTFLSDHDIEALAHSDTVATFLPATEFSTRQPYPDGRRALDAGVTVALASNCNPGSSYTTSMSFCIALAVREMGLTAAEALTAATLGGAQALRRTDVGWLGADSRADLVILDAPSYTYLVYRPGVPLVSATVVDGIVQ